MDIKIKRIYDLPDAADGTRILVDRLWPRGVSKNRAHLDDWLKDIAPSPDLRVWFDHREDHFAAFAEKYRMELDTGPEKQPAIAQVLKAAEGGPVTLLYAAKSPTVNHAIVLRDYLLKRAAT